MLDSGISGTRSALRTSLPGRSSLREIDLQRLAWALSAIKEMFIQRHRGIDQRKEAGRTTVF
jgi:hypothetical protein